MPYRNLKSLRTKHDLTQDDVASLLGISTVAYRSKENGNRPFSLDEARKIAEFFRLTIEEIFFENEVYNKETYTA